MQFISEYLFYYPPNLLREILICLFTAGFPSNLTLIHFLPMRTTWVTNLILLGLIITVTLDEVYKLRSSHYAVIYNFLPSKLRTILVKANRIWLLIGPESSGCIATDWASVVRCRQPQSSSVLNFQHDIGAHTGLYKGYWKLFLRGWSDRSVKLTTSIQYRHQEWSDISPLPVGLHHVMHNSLNTARNISFSS
jgi:hypothetical protein